VDGAATDVDFVDAVPPLTFAYYRSTFDELLPAGAPTTGGTAVTVGGGEASNIA
jgi:hypothetical protein